MIEKKSFEDDRWGDRYKTFYLGNR